VLRRKVCSAIKRDKREHLESICEEIEHCVKTNQSRNLFEHVNRVTKKACPKVKLIQSETGAILTEDGSIPEWRQEYYANLYSAPDSDTASDATQGTSKTSDNTADVCDGNIQNQSPQSRKQNRL